MKLEDVKEKIDKYFESDASIKFFEELTEQYNIREARQERFTEYLKTHDFDKLIYRLINEHNDDYIEKCYHEGREPYANNKLWFVFCYAMKKGKSVRIKELDTGFPYNCYLFNGYYFQQIYGQGTLLRIYNKDDMRLLLQL